MAAGALPSHVKELMALVVAVVNHCDGCVAYHARGAAKAGATEAEVAEALSVALLMGGGPSSVWAPRAFAAFHEFAPTDEHPSDEGQPTGASTLA
jgi:AhpD family alkylhydroperoxidase